MMTSSSVESCVPFVYPHIRLWKRKHSIDSSCSIQFNVPAAVSKASNTTNGNNPVGLHVFVYLHLVFACITQHVHQGNSKNIHDVGTMHKYCQRFNDSESKSKSAVYVLIWFGLWFVYIGLHLVWCAFALTSFRQWSSVGIWIILSLLLMESNDSFDKRKRYNAHCSPSIISVQFSETAYQSHWSECIVVNWFW